MSRLLLRAAATVQMGVVFATAMAWPALFIPAAAGLVLLVCAIPEAE